MDPILFSAVMASMSGPATLMAFFACIATDADAFRAVLKGRIGVRAAREALIVVGVDGQDELVVSMLGSATIRLLRWAAAHPDSPLVEGLVVQHFQVLGSADDGALA